MRVLKSAALSEDFDAVTFSPFLRILLRILKSLGKIQEIRWVLNNAIALIHAHDDRPFKAALLDRNENSDFLNTFTEFKLQLPIDRLKFAKNVYEAYLEIERNYSNHTKFLDRLIAQLREVDRLAPVSQKRSSTNLDHSRYQCLGTPLLDFIRNYREFNFDEEFYWWKDVEARCLSISMPHNMDQNPDDGAVGFEVRNSNLNVHLNGLPPNFRDFVTKLPSYLGPPPDTDLFLRQIRTVILPPRPLEEEPIDGAKKGMESSSTFLLEDSFRKRQRLL